MKLYSVIALAGIAAITYGCDRANERMDRRMGDVPLTTQSFVDQAGSANLAEVQVGQLALERGKSSAVKEFARQMVDDHTKANKELSDLASAKNLTLPSALPSDQRSTLDSLRQKSGEDFDRAFADQMIKDHKQAVNLFQDAAKQANLDQDVRNYAQRTLPTLEHHRSQAESLENAVKNNS